jgi:hypothetical protein
MGLIRCTYLSYDSLLLVCDASVSDMGANDRRHLSQCARTKCSPDICFEINNLNG